MKKTAFLILVICLATTFAYAEEAATKATTATAVTSVTASDAAAVAATPADTMVLKGDIIDNMCACSQKPEMLLEFIKTHTKQCALQPACVGSGYTIFADGKLYAFDKASNAKIEEFLKKADSKLQVVAAAKKAGDELVLVSIENQK